MSVTGDKSKYLAPSELSAFCRQMSHVLKSGIGIGEGLAFLREQAYGSKGIAAMDAMLKRVQAGEPFYTGLEDAECFPGYMVDMVRMGETVGKLEEVLTSLSEYYQRENQLKATVRASIRYPMAMLAMTVLVLGVLLVKVLPVFDEVYRKLGVQLSGISQGLLVFGQGLSRYAIVIIAVIAVLGAGIFVLRTLKSTKQWLSRLWERLFITRKLLFNISVARFAFAMSMMLYGGYNPEQAIEMAARLVTHGGLRQKVDGIVKKTQNGESLKDALLSTGMFTGLSAQLLELGFRTGSIDSVMQDVATNCQNEVNESMSRLVSMIEPVLVAVLATLMGMVMLSVILPLIGVMNTLL